MEKIHRKNQAWLYQKFKQEQKKEETISHKVYINQKQKENESKETLYRVLDIAKYGVPVVITLLGILLML